MESLDDSFLYRGIFKVEQPDKTMKNFVVTIDKQQHPYEDLSMSISTEKSYLFLYKSQISEEDYTSLQEEYNTLSPDYKLFPGELVGLLENGRMKKEGLFVKFNIGTTRISLTIYEKTEIQPVIVLLLNFDIATEEEVNHNVRKIIGCLKTSIFNLNTLIDDLKESMKLKEEQMQVHTISQNALFTRHLTEMENRYSTDLEKLLIQQATNKQKEMDHLKSFVLMLGKDNREMNEKNKLLEEKLAEIQEKFESKSEEVKELTKRMDARDAEEDSKLDGTTKTESGFTAAEIKKMQRSLQEKQTSEEKMKQAYLKEVKLGKKLNSDCISLFKDYKILREDYKEIQLKLDISSKDLEKAHDTISAYIADEEKLQAKNDELTQLVEKLRVRVGKNQAEAVESGEEELSVKNEELEKLKEHNISLEKYISSLYRKIHKLEDGAKKKLDEPSTSKDVTENVFQESDGAKVSPSSSSMEEPEEDSP